MTETRPPCPHCSGMAGIMTAARVAEIAAALQVETSLCATPAVYEARLERCASCTGLWGGGSMRLVRMLRAIPGTAKSRILPESEWRQMAEY
jgi:hypothetical protein